MTEEKKMPLLVFEALNSQGNAGTMSRAKVPDGWLVRMDDSGPGYSIAVCFVPDPRHEWDGGNGQD